MMTGGLPLTALMDRDQIQALMSAETTSPCIIKRVGLGTSGQRLISKINLIFLKAL